MSHPAISVRNLGKRYSLGAALSENTLRDHIAQGVRRLFESKGKNEKTKKKAQEPFWALKEVSFDIQPGEVVGVIGRNGAGKSTLLKVLSQITEPTEGEVRIRGRVASLLEVGTGFHYELTGRENIFLNGAILGMSKAEIQRKFDEIVDFSGLEKFLDTPVKRYSSGMFMRLAFAVAAHLEPEILIVDEVLAVGDASFQQKCLGKMQDVSRGGRTILFVSHNMAAVQQLCTRCLMLKKGMLVESGAADSVINAYVRECSTNSKFTLENFPDRSGSGVVRLTGFHLEDEGGNKTAQVQSGSDFNLVFPFKCAESCRKVDIGISIHQSDETALSVMYSSYKGQKFETIPMSGEFRCRVKRLPLKEGRYLVGVRVEAEGEEADWPRGMIGELEVIAGDFYGSGARGFDGAAPLLLSADWSVR